MSVYVVISLETSLECNEDEYPSTQSSVKLHVATRNKQDARDAYEKLNEQCALDNLKNQSITKQLVLTTIPYLDFYNDMGMELLSTKHIHDTLTQM